MKTAIIYIIFSILFLSCNENTEQSNPNLLVDLIGEWTVSEACSTNGPICYELPKNQAISFTKSSKSENEIYYSWALGDESFKDLFVCEIQDNKILGVGEYLLNNIDNGESLDKFGKQFIEIEFLEHNKINLILKREVFDDATAEMIVGDISNFYAFKQK